MKNQLLALAIASGWLVVAAPAFADHNSKNGEGWANMPNDIHNTRIETRESGDNETFTDFVKYGEGSKTDNRFDSDETQPNRAAEQKGEARTIVTRAANKGEAKAEKQINTRAAQREKRRIETRSRMHTDAAGMSPADRDTGAQRSGGSRRGGRH